MIASLCTAAAEEGREDGWMLVFLSCSRTRAESGSPLEEPEGEGDLVAASEAEGGGGVDMVEWIGGEGTGMGIWSLG